MLWLPEAKKIGLAAAVLAWHIDGAPERCGHGVAGVPPRGCPRDACALRAVEWAWFLARMGREPFELRDADVDELEKDVRRGRR